MSDKPEPNPKVGEMLALVVHDLRNPVATISANLSFIKDVAGLEDQDAIEALEDVDIALADLTRGLEQLAWVGRWLGGQKSAESGNADARTSVEQGVRRAGADVGVTLPDEPLTVSCAGTALARLTELLVRNAVAHGGTVNVTLRTEGTDGVLEVADDGAAVGEDLRDDLFSLDGQQKAKGRADGRYSRVVGLLAVRALADGMGATLRAEGETGAAKFVVTLPG